MIEPQKKLHRKFAIASSGGNFNIKKSFNNQDEINNFYDFYIKDNRNGKIIGEHVFNIDHLK